MQEDILANKANPSSRVHQLDRTDQLLVHAPTRRPKKHVHLDERIRPVGRITPTGQELHLSLSAPFITSSKRVDRSERETKLDGLDPFGRTLQADRSDGGFWLQAE